VGLAWSVGVIAEIGVMIFAPRFIGRLRSSVFLCICAAVATARWALLAHLSSRAGILALQPLHGITFGLWYLSMVRFVQTRAPDQLRTSLQSMALSAMGLGMVTGYLGGGLVLERLGGTWLYRLAAAAAGAALAVYLGTTRARRTC
jgi:predicted MFS family arabinose efflux permease